MYIFNLYTPTDLFSLIQNTERKSPLLLLNGLRSSKTWPAAGILPKRHLHIPTVRVNNINMMYFTFTHKNQNKLIFSSLMTFSLAPTPHKNVYVFFKSTRTLLFSVIFYIDLKEGIWLMDIDMKKLICLSNSGWSWQIHSWKLYGKPYHIQIFHTKM